MMGICRAELSAETVGTSSQSADRLGLTMCPHKHTHTRGNIHFPHDQCELFAVSTPQFVCPEIRFVLSRFICACLVARVVSLLYFGMYCLEGIVFSRSKRKAWICHFELVSIFFCEYWSLFQHFTTQILYYKKRYGIIL